MLFDVRKYATATIAAIGISAVSGSPVTNAKNGVRFDFINNDSYNRTLVFTGNPGAPPVADLVLGPYSNTTYYVPNNVSITSHFHSLSRDHEVTSITSRSASIVNI